MNGAGLAIFGAFLGALLKGWVGGAGKTPAKELDKLTRKDKEDEINRSAREKVLSQ
jgi:hypothetical protein